AAPNFEEAELKLRLWGRYSGTDGGFVENTMVYLPSEKPEHTLVLIKPDNFRFPTGRPGNVIDFFSRAGLYIVAIKVHRMSTAEAMEFYEPVREILRSRMNDTMAAKSKAVLEKEFGFKIPAKTEKELGELLGTLAGEPTFVNYVIFMFCRAHSADMSVLF